MINAIRFSLICIAVSLPGLADLPQDPIEYASWEQRTLVKIRSQEGEPPTIAIPTLGDWVVKYSTSMNREKGERPVFHAAQQALLAIPGHAKYYQDKIESLRKEVLDNETKSPTEMDEIRAERRKMADQQKTLYCDSSDFDNYASAVFTSFPVLALLPSSETVDVLGHFLNDPEARDGKTLLGRTRYRGDVYPYPANAEEAARAIGKLGIENPPWVKPKHIREGDTDREVDAWKDWWNEVKEGKRTYRFIGSSIEYGPDGPITKVKSRQAQPEQHPGRRLPSDAMSFAGVLAACGLCVAGIWLYLRAKRPPAP